MLLDINNRACRNAGKNLKPYQGLKRRGLDVQHQIELSRKKPKTLSGIETKAGENELTVDDLGRKKPKTLSGIETVTLRRSTD